AAAQSLSPLLGRDVVSMVDLDDANRRREVRKLQGAPSRPVLFDAAKAAAAAQPKRSVVTVEDFSAPVLTELRTAIRGRTLAELCTTLNKTSQVVTHALSALQ